MTFFELKQHFNRNKFFIDQVLNDPLYRQFLSQEQLCILKELVGQTIQLINEAPEVDNPEYSFLYINYKKLDETYFYLEKMGLIKIIERKGGYTGITFHYITLNFDRFEEFVTKTQENSNHKFPKKEK